MSSMQGRVELAGSRKASMVGVAFHPTDPQERFDVTIQLRRQAALPAQFAAHQSQQDISANHGVHPDDLAKVISFVRDHHGLSVLGVNRGSCSLFVSGTASQFASAFGVTLHDGEHPAGGTFRTRSGTITIPAELQDIIVGVFGLDNRPCAKAHFQIAKDTDGQFMAHVGSKAFTPVELAKLYNFPAGADGTGQCIAIIELGGGYRSADINAYFSSLGMAPPRVKAISVDHGRNAPSTPDGADGEVMLDIEVAAAVAPKAVIAVYFAPNTDKGFLDALNQAIHDTVNKPSVISISWGASESNWTAQAMDAFHAAMQTAAAMGITVCVASGDNGSSNGETDGLQHVDFPSASPYALACGGTKLLANGTTIAQETVWNANPTSSASGGGVSEYFAKPDYQTNANVPASVNSGHHFGRGVPDVSGDADPATGYKVRVDGQTFVIGGTSAVAPLWAGLIALLNQKLGKRVGYLQPQIYPLMGKGVFHDITQGNNGRYSARTGWDPCTGLGSPNGAALYAALGGK